MTENSFAADFLAVAERFPGKCALDLDGRQHTYQQLSRAALSLAATLQRSNRVGTVGLLARHSLEAYQGMLGIFLSGAAYLPLTPENPSKRNLEFLRQSECTCLLVDRVGWEAAAPILGSNTALTIIRMDAPAPECADIAKVTYSTQLAKATEWERPAHRDSAIAYVIFTSGSSGAPKATQITNANTAAAIAVLRSRIRPCQTDRVSQGFELSFDGSLANVFLAWTSGACLVPVLPGTLLGLRNQIRKSRMTIWAATPTVATLMRRLGAMQPNSFPELRHSIFAGEPVGMDLLAAWGLAAPNSIIDNLYGQTEATILCTGYRWDRDSARTSTAKIAPIGTFLGEMKGRVVNADLEEVEAGETGELLVSGPQVSPGYLDPELTHKHFVRPFEPGKTYYRTGDLVRFVDGQLLYLGRLDQQIKIRGNRVELGEIESHLRKLTGCDRAVAIGWPTSHNGADGVVGFVEAAETSVDIGELQRSLSLLLPKYMVPNKIIAVPRFPLNPHGKIDRTALGGLVDAAEAKQRGLIVLGVPRSGTTLLRRLLDGHPDLSCPGETYLLSACARFIQNDTMPNGISVGVLPGLAHLQIDSAQVLERLRDFFIEVHVAHSAARGKTHWAEKTAQDVFYIDEIERLIGDHAKFLVMLRHGLDVAASLVELAEKVGGYYRELHRYISQCPYPLEAFVRMWSERTSALLDFAERRASQVCLVRYEDLVSDTENVINGVFRFIGISEQANLVERVLTGRDAMGIGDWKAFQYTSVRAERAGRWKMLSPSHVPKLARIANPVLIRAGYPPITEQDQTSDSDRDTRYAKAMRLSHLVPKGSTDAK
jgi:amino acid adenylation domain-containing protein